MILDRSAFVSMDDSDAAYVDIPEAGEGATVRVRSLTGDQRSRVYTRAAIDDKAGAPAGYWRALACAMGMIDDHGAYLFPNEAEGAAIIGRKHPDVIERISDKILDLSTMTKAARDAAVKKSQTATTSNGGISSPEPSTPDTDSTLSDSSATPPADA